MNSNNMYKQLVFYLETCESGSMFDKILKDNLNIYAVTAANPTESSWGTYCYPNDVVEGKHMQTCLGDLFSVNWMENADAVSPNQESLEQQFNILLTKTAKSHVMRYGSMSFTDSMIGEFEGILNHESASLMDKIFEGRRLHGKTDREELSEDDKLASTVSSRDAKLHHLYARTAENGDHRAHLDLSTELNHRMRVDSVFDSFKSKLLGADQYHTPTNFECLRALVGTYKEHCGPLEDYSLKYVRHLVTECETIADPSDFSGSIEKLKDACSH